LGCKSRGSQQQKCSKKQKQAKKAIYKSLDFCGLLFLFLFFAFFVFV